MKFRVGEEVNSKRRILEKKLSLGSLNSRGRYMGVTSHQTCFGPLLKDRRKP